MPPRGYSPQYDQRVRALPSALIPRISASTPICRSNTQDQVERARENIRPTGFDMPSGRLRHHGACGLKRMRADERSQARAAAADRVSRDDALSNGCAAIEAESFPEPCPTPGTRFPAIRAGLARSTDSSSRPSQSRSFGGSSFDTGLFDDIDRGAAESRALSSAERAIAQRPPSTSHSRRAGAVHVGSYNAYGQGLYNHTRQQASGDSPERTRRLDDAPARPSSRRSNPAAAGSTRRLRRSEDEEKETYMPRQSRRSALPEEHSISVYAAPSNLGRNKSGIGEKLPFLIAGIIILLLVVVIAFLANGVGSKSNVERPTKHADEHHGASRIFTFGLFVEYIFPIPKAPIRKRPRRRRLKRLKPLPLRPLLRTRSRRAKRRMSKSMKATHAWLPKMCRAARLTATT